MALRVLASTLSFPGTNGAKSALLCCQVFISIEQVRGNYTILAEHIIQGLGIMREHGARPRLTFAHELLPAHHDKVPLLDVFIIKLFAAPCKFAEPLVTSATSAITVDAQPTSSHRESCASRKHRTIAPDIRAKLTKIATATLAFLNKVSRVETAGEATQLLPDKATLQASLHSWLLELELNFMEAQHPSFELISVLFMRILHRILSIILRDALEVSQERGIPVEREVQDNYLRGLASSIEKRVKL
jgi:hypothetical protein